MNFLPDDLQFRIWQTYFKQFVLIEITDAAKHMVCKQWMSDIIRARKKELSAYLIAPFSGSFAKYWEKEKETDDNVAYTRCKNKVSAMVQARREALMRFVDKDTSSEIDISPAARVVARTQM